MGQFIGHDRDHMMRVAGNRIRQRSVSETIGLCRGILADGVVDLTEANTLLIWLEGHPEVIEEWPFNTLLSRLYEILEDGILDSSEEAELLDTLMKLTGAGKSVALGQGPMELPLDNPAPKIEWDRRNFVFTGELACAKRAKAQEATCSVGGLCPSGVSSKTDYLVLGTFGSVGWLYSTHGTKIKKAMKLREVGSGIHIISEEHWLNELNREMDRREAFSNAS